jgi:hypothetical protein
VRFILTGSNLATESIMPISWGHYNQDLKHLKAIHKTFGKLPIKTLPTISLFDYFYYVFIKGIRQIPFLNYIQYDKDEAKKLLTEELRWRDYGGKHYESVWTRFFQGYYLPTKFGFDKRRAHLSSIICSGGMTREQALMEMEKPIYPTDVLQQDLQFAIKKFKLTHDEWNKIMCTPPRLATEYPSHFFLFHRMRVFKNAFRWIATSP